MPIILMTFLAWIFAATSAPASQATRSELLAETGWLAVHLNDINLRIVKVLVIVATSWVLSGTGLAQGLLSVPQVVNKVRPSVVPVISRLFFRGLALSLCLANADRRFRLFFSY